MSSNAIAAATENALVVNYPNLRKLKPNQNITRGEVAALICQALQIKNVVPSQYIAGNESLIIPAQFDTDTIIRAH